MSGNNVPTRQYEPDSDDCVLGRDVRVVVGEKVYEGRACWYPQMGGYVGKALVLSGGNRGECFDMLVWHGGEFPFMPGDTRLPAELHHCMAEQFRDFADVLDAVDLSREEL